MVEPPRARSPLPTFADRANQARIIDAAVREEGLVLGRGESVDQPLREFVVAELHPAFAREGLDGFAVDVAHVARQRRLIGQQRFG
jgi:hypothetical protein